MSIVKFKFNKGRDLLNVWETANAKAHYGYDFKKGVTKNILRICRNRKYESCRKELYQTMSPLYKNPLVDEVVDVLSKSWERIEGEYFERLERVTEQRFPFKKVNAYLTTSGRCPYDCDPRSPSFHFNFFWGLPVGLQTSGHELMHIHLHNFSWWEEVEKEIGNKKAHDLKEALTELLNLEFRDLWIVDDRGYPNHTKLRNYISLQWKKKKDFDLLTEKCIKWIKVNGVK